MSIRLKVFLIITVIILAITASSVVISVTSAQNEIINTLENGMSSVAKVANGYLSDGLDTLMDDASQAVQAMIGVQTENLNEILVEQTAAFNEAFTSITILNASGKIDIFYPASAPESLAFSDDGKLALAGRRVISSSYLTPSGNAVFYIFVPIDEAFDDRARGRVAVFTVPGDFFSKKVNQFYIGGGGTIALGDRDGVIIADADGSRVTQQIRLIDLIQNSKKSENSAEFIRRMIAGETDTGRFYFNGEDAVTAFMPLTSSNQGWFITVSSPLSESAYSQVRRLILISGFIFLGLGLIAAALASGSVAKPFYQIRKQNKQLEELNEQVKAAAVAKTNFLANMSFDLRTPLNAIIGLSELSLTKKDVPGDVKDYLDRIYGSGEKIMDVINDLMDLSNMESGKFGIMPAEYDLAAIINETAHTNTIHIGSKPVKFSILPDEKLPARLVGDTLRVRQVFNNLISNAFRFTSVGSVEWKISAEREGDSVWLVSSITDTGIGIKSENIEKLFIDYNRLDTDRMQRDAAGGMGLTLTKKITDLMDGKITVESVVGKGSTFTVRIRQKWVNDEVIGADALNNLKNFKYIEQKPVDKSDIQRIQLAGKRVLVVDDVEINLEIAVGMLEPYGLAVDCLSNGQEAVELIRLADPQYDAIFISRWMRELDGKEAVRIIRGEIDNEYAKNVPIIALITSTVIGNKDIFQKWGFNDVLSKPLDISRLDEVVHHWLGDGHNR